MKFFEKKNVVKIAEDDLKDAKLSSMDFTDTKTRKQAFVDVLGARLAMKLLFSQKIEANNEYSLYTIHNVLEELDLADIYYQGIKIDVRLVFNKEEIFVPRAHFDYELLPDLYLVLCLKENMSSAEFLGFFEPKDLDKKNANQDFYFFEQEQLAKPEKLKSFLDNYIVETDFEISESDTKKSEELFLSLVDKEISKKDKLQLLKDLAKSLPLREKLVEFENFEIISKAAAKKETMMTDSTLEYVGGRTEDAISVEEIEIPTSETVETAETENKGFHVNGAVIAGGAVVAAAGLGFAGELAKGAAQASAAGIEAQGAAIGGVATVAAAGLELSSEFLQNVPKPKTDIHDFFGAKSDTDLVDLDSADMSFANSADNDFLDVSELPDFDAVDESETETEIENIFTDSDEFSDFEIEEKAGEEEQRYEIDEINEIEKTEDDEFAEFDITEDAVDADELPNFEQVEDFEEKGTLSTEDLLNAEIDDELFETEEVQNFDILDDLDQDLEQEAENIAETETEANVDADAPQVEETFEQVGEPSTQTDDSEFEYREYSGDDLPDFGYLMENDMDEVEMPNFGCLVQDGVEENAQVEGDFEAETPADFAEEPLAVAEMPVDEINLEGEDLQELKPIESIAFGMDDFTLDGSLPELALEETAPMEELNELKEDGSLAGEEADEQAEEVFNLDDFDFKLLEEEEENVAAPEPAQAPETENAAANDKLTFVEDPDTLEKFRKLEELELEEEEYENKKDEDVEPKFEESNVENNHEAETDSDDFISQVDELLKDSVVLDEHKAAFLESALLDEEPETPVEETPTITPESDDDLLKVLFEKEDLDNLSDMGIEEGEPKIQSTDVDMEQKKKKMIVAASIAGVVLVSFVIGGSITSKNNNLPKDMTNAPISADGQMDSQTQPNDMTTDMTQPMGQTSPGQSVQALPGEDQQTDLSRDMGKAVSDAFTSDPVNASISKIAWEVPEDLAYNDSFRKYLQIAGKNLKLNLQNDLLLATEMAYSNKVIVDLKIGKDSSLQSENVLVSSGSKQIDKIVLQSVKDTLKYLKMPSSELSGGSVGATLIINF